MLKPKTFAAAAFTLCVVFGLTEPTRAGFSCQGASCYGSWGNLINDFCTFSEMPSCINAAETCEQFCDPEGIQQFSCNSGEGSCTCERGILCPSCTLDPGSCDGGTWFDYFTCSCVSSPLIADLAGNGVALTDAVAGVSFDLTGDGRLERISWTAAGSDDGFLALDRNLDGQINDGTELFGTSTAQPPGDEPNGFLALAVFDGRADGGNGDGVVDRRDAVFSRLVFWIDVNHNGQSEATELKKLADAGVRRIDLDFQESNRRDQFGNQFRYRARIWDNIRRTRWIWDVFLKVAPST